MSDKELHPRAIDLAWLSELDGGADGAEGEMAEHLRWCGHCRSAVADHRWLQDEVTATLATAAGAVSVPRPRWWDVQELVLANQRRQARGWWMSAIASVVSAVCLMLAVSPMFGPMFGPVFGTAVVASQTAPPVAASVAAAIATAPDVSLSTASFPPATPTPVVFDEARDPSSPTPVLLLPPTPAQPEI